MTYTIEEIQKIFFLDGLRFELSDYQGECEEANIVKALVPKDIDKQLDNVIDYCLDQARILNKHDLEEFIRGIPPGMTRMNVREIYRNRFVTSIE